jgi:hypothetical protein
VWPTTDPQTTFRGTSRDIIASAFPDSGNPARKSGGCAIPSAAECSPAALRDDSKAGRAGMTEKPSSRSCGCQIGCQTAARRRRVERNH